MSMVTIRTAKRMQEDRKVGMLYRELADKYGVCIDTVRRHTSEKTANKMRTYERATKAKAYVKIADRAGAQL